MLARADCEFLEIAAVLILVHRSHPEVPFVEVDPLHMMRVGFEIGGPHKSQFELRGSREGEDGDQDEGTHSPRILHGCSRFTVLCGSQYFVLSRDRQGAVANFADLSRLPTTPL